MQPTARSLAQTYSDRVYPDPWEKVLDYRRVIAYAAEHPNAGRVRVGNALDLPPGRVRSWLDGGIPDPARGVHTASQNEWLNPSPDSETAGALVELLAHVLAGGSITVENYAPAVTPSERVTTAEISRAFQRVGVETRSRNADTPGRATEVVPTCDGTVLGRCLVTMGAAHGDKTTIEQLPSIVLKVPIDVRRKFLQIYIGHRATTWESKATLRIQEQRPRSYLNDLKRLITDVTGEPVTTGDLGVTVSADAARELGFAQSLEKSTN